MKIQIWNAYASNNSGSYTIVGSFPDAKQAARVADELRAIIDAHHDWLERQASRWELEGTSPLDELLARENITSTEAGRTDDWPEHGPKPEIGAAFEQVVLHVDYTVTMPAAFGELFYRRGGRVDVELDHSHAPLVWTHEVWWPWQNRDEARVEQQTLAMLHELTAEGGLFVTGTRDSAAPSWRDGGGRFGHADLTLAVVWDEPVARIAALAEIVERHGAGMRTRVLESWSEDDPAGLFRPCSPAL